MVFECDCGFASFGSLVCLIVGCRLCLVFACGLALCLRLVYVAWRLVCIGAFFCRLFGLFECCLRIWVWGL